MGLKKLTSLKSFEINSAGSRSINSVKIGDLITKSQAALSSQASVFQTLRSDIS